ncbi:hypothetical protein F5888DRAFT_1633822 [Russula emetica]|nr:hypothetical protein F5888DRAFT_1633822 [Russula emetica]
MHARASVHRLVPSAPSSSIFASLLIRTRSAKQAMLHQLTCSHSVRHFPSSVHFHPSLASGDQEGRTGCQGQSDKEETLPMAEMGCTMYDNPLQLHLQASMQMTSKPVNGLAPAGIWLGYVDEPNAFEIDEQMAG